ncbi:MAG: PHP domain-containing protein [Eubacteriales bacterium]|nr:PHP domain-containing protein [Eubacteriales bacterium]
MNKYYYDFHIHSCLSPCGDNDNTPANLAGMATLNNLQVVALTDHNTCKNCPAFFKAAKAQGIIPIAGMELTTAEDIHIVFLFEKLEDALCFSEYIETRRILIENRVDIFGEQLVINEIDEVIGTDLYLLSNATNVSVDECPSLAEKFSGICYPAHVDREANGIIAVLGTFPDIKGFRCCEFHDASKIEEYKSKYPIGDRHIIVSSDAHFLWDMKEAKEFFLVDDEPYSSDLVRHRIFEALR